MYKIYTDGGARGNPGPAAVGVVIIKVDPVNKEETIVARFGKKIGVATNNVAEYQAVIEGLNWLIANSKPLTAKKTNIEFCLDSKLVASQLSGIFKIKDSKLRELLFLIRQLEAKLAGNIFYRHIPREQNQAADFEVNKALDEKSYLT